MVASRKVEIPYYRDVGRQRGRGFGALAGAHYSLDRIIGRTAIPFLRKYIVPAAKRVGADLLDFAVPQVAEVVSGRRNIKTAAKCVGRQTLRKQLGEGEGSRRRTGSRRKGAVGGKEGGSTKRTASRVIPTKSTKHISRSRRDIFNNFTNISH